MGTSVIYSQIFKKEFISRRTHRCATKWTRKLYNTLSIVSALLVNTFSTSGMLSRILRDKTIADINNLSVDYSGWNVWTPILSNQPIKLIYKSPKLLSKRIRKRCLGNSLINISMPPQSLIHICILYIPLITPVDRLLRFKIILKAAPIASRGWICVSRGFLTRAGS